MALEQTKIKDSPGAALYVLYDGSMLQERYWKQFLETIKRHAPNHQTVLLSAQTSDGEKVRAFYGFERSKFPVVFIILDNDQLDHIWYGQGSASVEHIAHRLKQMSSH